MMNNLIIFINRFLNKCAQFSPGGSSIRPWLQKMRGVHIGYKVWIGQYVYFDELYPELISIGDNSTIGLRVSIITHFHRGNKQHGGYSSAVTIDKDVFIGPHCVILPSVHIGEGAVIKAGTGVSKNVPAHIFWGSDIDGPLGVVTIPLTPENDYNEFRYGVRPIDNKKQ
jgi:heptaprenylglycerol acetyltransferase